MKYTSYEINLRYHHYIQITLSTLCTYFITTQQNIIVYSNITIPGYSIAQQETVRGKIRMVNQVKNIEIRFLQNLEDGP